jgi:hypothetical protein
MNGEKWIENFIFYEQYKCDEVPQQKILENIKLDGAKISLFDSDFSPDYSSLSIVKYTQCALWNRCLTCGGDEGYSRNVPDEGYSRNVSDEGYSRNVSCALSLIFTFLLLVHV